MKKLTLGVVGLGEGRSIISGALASQLWELKLLCDLNPQLCKERAEEFKFTHTTTDMNALLADPSIDVVAFYTPDALHAQHIKLALQAGKHVICTKPLLDNLSQAKSLLELSKQTDRHVFVGQSSRHFAPMMKQRVDFDAGKHGPLYSVEAHYHADNRWFLKRDWAKGGGMKWLYNGISHPIDLVRWYMPNISEVMGYGLLTENGRSLGLTDPDSMHFVMQTADGKIARVSGCYSSPTGLKLRDSGMTCILRGEKGTSQADYSDLRYSTHFSGEGSVLYDLEHLAGYYFRFGGRSHHAGEYQNYIEYFARCLNEGVTPKPDIREGIVTVATMVAMEQSLNTKRPVKVADVLRENGLEELVSDVA